MARKIFIVYLVYTVIVYLINTYAFKESYADAILKAVLSGVVFTAIYAFVVIKHDKGEEEKRANIKPGKKSTKKR